MVLNPTTLTEAILDLTDDTRGTFVGHPFVLDASGALDLAATLDLVATNWAGAAAQYFTGISVPAINPGGIPAGAAAFKAAMLPLLGVPGGAAAALAAGFDAFALVVVANTIPPNVSLPPPPGTLTVPIGPPTMEPEPPAANIASAVFSWTKTGLTGPPPSAPSVPWS
jgi:hypothetical protein